jgi:hypothetical protein
MVLDHIPKFSRVVDILTKPLAKGKFDMLREKFSLVENTFLKSKSVFFHISPSMFSINQQFMSFPF